LIAATTSPERTGRPLETLYVRCCNRSARMSSGEQLRGLLEHRDLVRGHHRSSQGL